MMSTRLVRATEGDTYDHLGLRLRMRLTGEDTAGSLALIEHIGRRGTGPPLHRHTREDETFIVLDGDLDGWSDGDHTVVTAGDTLHLARSVSPSGPPRDSPARHAVAWQATDRSDAD